MANYPISKGQIKTIKMLCRQLGISSDTEHDMIEERYAGKRSCTQLTYTQAGHFIRELESKGGTIIQVSKPKKQQLPRPVRKPAPFAPPIPRDSNVIALATPDEIDKINKIAALITWRAENGLKLFLEKRMKIKDGRVRTGNDAYLAIEGLKKMYINQMAAAHGKNWWALWFDAKEIRVFIAEHCPVDSQGPGYRITRQSLNPEKYGAHDYKAWHARATGSVA